MTAGQRSVVTEDDRTRLANSRPRDDQAVLRRPAVRLRAQVHTAPSQVAAPSANYPPQRQLQGSGDYLNSTPAPTIPPVLPRPAP